MINIQNSVNIIFLQSIWFYFYVCLNKINYYYCFSNSSFYCLITIVINFIQTNIKTKSNWRKKIMLRNITVKIIYIKCLLKYLNISKAKAKNIQNRNTFLNTNKLNTNK